MPTGNEDEAMPTRTEDEVNPTRTDTYRGRSQPNMYPLAPRTKSTQHVPRKKPGQTGTEDEANRRNITKKNTTRQKAAQTATPDIHTYSSTRQGQHQPTSNH